MNQSTKIAIVIEQGFGARVLLQTKLLYYLLSQNLDVYILTSGPKSIKRYLSEHNLNHIPVHTLETCKYDKRNQNTFVRLFKFIRLYSLNTQTMKDNFKLQISDTKLSTNLNTKIFMFLVRILVNLSRIDIRIIKLFTYIENKIATVNGNQTFFSQYKPDVIITTSIGNFDHDDHILREAKSYSVQTITYILGWDNTSTRGHGVNLSDHIIAWSPIMKQELVDIHGIDKQRITVGGVSHYDAYKDPTYSLWSKQFLYSKYDIPDHKKLILFGTKSPSSYKSNPEIVQKICHWLNTDPELEDYILICRLHPIYFRDNRGKAGTHFGEDWNQISEEAGANHLIIDYPEIIDGDLNYFMPSTEITKLGSLLMHSKISINMFSTLNLEASIFDVPCINVAFQNDNIHITGFKQARYNIKVDQNKTHTQRLINTHATSVANNFNELLNELKNQIHNPTSKQSQREKLIKQECHDNLGAAGMTVARLITKLIQNK